MAGFKEAVGFMKTLQRSLEKNNVTFNLKVKQVIGIYNIYQGRDVFALLPTGYGKSVIYQLLPDMFDDSKIIIVVSPLNSIIKDQMDSLTKKNIKSSVLNCFEEQGLIKLFDDDDEVSNDSVKNKPNGLPKELTDGKISIVFSHPESLLCEEGRKLLRSEIFQKQVLACVIDEAHCIKLW